MNGYAVCKYMPSSDFRLTSLASAHKDARAMLKGKLQRKIGHNTWLCADVSEDGSPLKDSFVVRFHATDIVAVDERGITKKFARRARNRAVLCRRDVRSVASRG